MDNTKKESNAGRQLKKIIRKNSKYLVGIVFLSVVTSALSSVTPLLQKQIVDDAIPNKDLKLALICIILMAAIPLFNVAMSTLNQKCGYCFTAICRNDLRRFYFRKILEMDYPAFMRIGPVKLMSVITRTIGKISSLYLNDDIIKASSSLVRILVIFGVLFYYNKIVAVTTFVVVPFTYFVIKFFDKKESKSLDNQKNHLQKCEKFLLQVFNGMKTIRSYSGQKKEINTFDEWLDNKLRRSIYPQYSDMTNLKLAQAEKESKGSAYEELNKMIGLKSAKRIVNDAINMSKAQKLYALKGMSRSDVSRHMVFTGNPGTAKTSVARLMARILKENEIIKSSEIVEVGRGDLVGKYVGWTAPTIIRKFKEAKGGILFIDEAYSLVDDRDGSYGDEAINTIVQEMENHRDDVIVIFAGYPDEMESFLDKNPGLRSRIAFHVKFEDYSVDELCGIAKLMAEEKGLKISEDAMEKTREVMAQAIKQRDFGNGRFVRNLIERAQMAQASRLVELNYDDISAEDIVISDYIPKEKHTIGFAV